MEDSSVAIENKSDKILPLGMSSFGAKDRRQFGQDIRLAMARAIKDRDQHCQFPRCTQTKNLQIHHIEHWADGGMTCVENGACLCQYHHTMVHEGSYRIEALSASEKRLGKQFSVSGTRMTWGCLALRRSFGMIGLSFDRVRSLSPTRYRFCVLDSEGQDLNDRRARINDESAG